MPVFQLYNKDKMQLLGLWKIDENLHDLMDAIEFNNIEVGEVRNYKSELKQRQWLSSRLLAEAIHPKIGQISYDEIGAPHVPSEFYISLSHSDKMVAVILDQREDVGIDIQYFTKKIDRIKEKFCSQDELMFANEKDELQALHLIWCAKEAIYKKLKNPGIIFSQDMDILPFNCEEKGVLKAKARTKGLNFSLNLKYEIVGDYTLVYTLNT